MRRYRYVGPTELRSRAASSPGVCISSAAALESWLASREAAELSEPFTFVVGLDGLLRLAPRRSEHVQCAAGEDVLAAGEIGFERAAGRQWRVVEVTNQSTGYCPEPDSWPAVAAALQQAGVTGPEGFTSSLLFRRCPACGEISVVRDGDFGCAFCGGELPRWWNVAPG